MKKLVLLFLISMPLIAAAQYSTSDAGFWSTISIKKELNKKFYLGLDQEIRLRENYTRLNLFYTNIGIGYKFSKGFKTELTYRSVEKFVEDNTFSFRHRIMADIIYRKKTSRFVFTNRLRYQIEVRDYFTSYGGKYPEQYFRFKSELKHDNGGRLTPYLNVEVRYQLSVPRGKNSYYNNTLHRIRFCGGFDYAFSETLSAGLYYLVQKEFNIAFPENNFITGIQVSKEF